MGDDEDRPVDDGTRERDDAVRGGVDQAVRGRGQVDAAVSRRPAMGTDDEPSQHRRWW
jgi:hypothetical protein